MGIKEWSEALYERRRPLMSTADRQALDAEIRDQAFGVFAYDVVTEALSAHDLTPDELSAAMAFATDGAYRKGSPHVLALLTAYQQSQGPRVPADPSPAI